MNPNFRRVSKEEMTAHYFTVDVEEYFHPTALESSYPYEAWESLPRRTPGIIDRLLDFLDETEVKGTFFTLGWLAEREPEMVRKIASRGHEIASHGWRHRLLTRLTPEEFRESISRSRDVLQELTGARVRGYRAPSFSIVPGGEWAFDVLLEEGYEYDSSLVPVTFHPTYGYPGVLPEPHRIARAGGEILEVPLTTLRMMGREVPMGGGAYFRFAPYRLVRRAFRRATEHDRPGVFYIHPWELDPDPPAIRASRLTRLRTLGANGDTWKKMARLISDFRFGPMQDALAAARSRPAPPDRP